MMLHYTTFKYFFLCECSANKGIPAFKELYVLYSEFAVLNVWFDFRYT